MWGKMQFYRRCVFHYVLMTILFCLVAVSRTAPTEFKDNQIRTLPAELHEEVHDEFGQYSLRYVTAENTTVSQRGRLVSGDDGFVLEVEGEYQFLGDDGVTYMTSYKAGPHGFQVEGQHLPESVSVPSVVQLI